MDLKQNDSLPHLLLSPLSPSHTKMASPQSEELLLGGKNPRHDSLRSSRRLLYVTCASLGAASLFALVLFALWTSQTRHQSNPSVTLEPSYLNKSAPVDLLGPETHLVGLPTSQFRGGQSLSLFNTSAECLPDNLRPDAKYITSWPSAGWSESILFHICPVTLMPSPSERRDDLRASFHRAI